MRDYCSRKMDEKKMVSAIHVKNGKKVVVKKTKKIWILKALYGKHLLDFLKFLYSNLMFS